MSRALRSDDDGGAVRAPAPGSSGPCSPTNSVFVLLIRVLRRSLFALGTPGFASPFNLFTLGRTMAINIMIGFSMMVVIVTGGLNLSVGAIGVCAAMVFGWLSQRVGLPLALAIPGALAMGAALGRGQRPVDRALGPAQLHHHAGDDERLLRRDDVRHPRRGVPQPAAGDPRLRQDALCRLCLAAAAVSAGVGLMLAVLYRLTPLGREMLAAGANAAAAELSGVRVGRVFVQCHVLSGALAGVAALMAVARTGAAIPSMAGDLGQDWLLPAFLGPVLGGTLLAGGRVSVLGAFLGAVLVSELTNGLLQFRVGEFWVQTYLGLLLLAAVLLDLARRKLVARLGLAP